MKFIIEMLHGLGDTVCALPMLQVVRENYPVAKIDVIVKSCAQSDIIHASKIKVDEIIYWDVHKCNLIDNIKMIRKLRERKYDYGVSSSNTPVKKAKIFMGLIGCVQVFGIQHEMNKTFDDLKDKYHFVEANLLAIKSFCDLPETVLRPKLFPKEQDIAVIKNMMTSLDMAKPVVGVCIGSGDYSLKNRWLRIGKVITKGWGIENIVTLVNDLAETGYNVLLFGGAMELDSLKYLDKIIIKHNNIVSLVAKTDLSQSIAAAYLCDLVVGVDTGMQHISSAVGTKTITIFGPTSPKMCGAYSEDAVFIEVEAPCKYCYGTKMYVNCEDRKCLNEIKVKMVVENIKKKLNI